MPEDYHPPDKPALLEVIHKERKNLETLLEGLTDAQKVESGVEADWSIKDIMAHIAAWERLAQDRIHATMTGEPLKISVITGDDFVDQFNANVFEENKDLPLDTVEKEFKESFLAFVTQIESLENDVLSKKLPFDWARDLTAKVLISANTHWHYLEHANSIAKWLDR